MASGSTILEVKDLTIDYYTMEGVIHAVNEVSFNIKEGETLCLVGESGSGKSTIGLAIAMALPENARVRKGEITYTYLDLVKASEKERKRIAGKEISIIFQDPAATLNPLFTIGEQMSDVLMHNLELNSKEEAFKKAEEILRRLGLPDPRRVLKSYPHELSGGMIQRVNIAIAVSSRPKVLVADEPTTMLDTTLQAQILDLLVKLKKEMGLAILFITHNLGVAAEVSDRIAVIYAGYLVEEGSSEEVLLNHLHPYTRRLIASVPRAHIKVERLSYIPGILPDPRHLPPGCPFADRCDETVKTCYKKMPPMIEVKPTHRVACVKYWK